MAGQVDKDVKAKLLASGRWRTFLSRRDELKAEGYEPDDAREMALAEASAAAPAARDAFPCDGVAAVTADDSGSLPMAPAELAGRMASEPEVARWVARNIDNMGATAAECPDPFAWTLLRMCRDSGAFRLMFVKDIWMKLLVSEAKRDEGGAAGDVELDGQQVLDLIGRIRGIASGESVGVSAGSHNPGVAGSIPAPAIVDEDDYDTQEICNG